jgi:hypothetical protein
MLGHWLDPPGIREHKRWQRAQPRGRGESDLEIGCLVPIGLVLAVAIGIGVLVGMQRSSVSTVGPTQAVVRVIDDGAPGGPRVLATAIVTQR